jgi:hypothetical protein
MEVNDPIAVGLQETSNQDAGPKTEAVVQLAVKELLQQGV